MICMIVIFWQWSGITEEVSKLVSQLDNVQRSCSGGSLIPEGSAPALIGLLLFNSKLNKKKNNRKCQ